MALPIAVVNAISITNEASLPVSILLGHSSTPGTGAASISSQVWTILAKGPASTAEFADDGTGNPGQTSTLQAPTLALINDVSNVRVFLTVIDNLGNQSNTDPLLAPDSAFGVAAVRYTQTGLQVTAKGQRNWQSNSWTQTARLNTLDGQFHNRVLNGIADVSDATSTGPHLDNLMDGGYATQNGLAGGTNLHKHPVGSVDPATTTENGVVTLEDTPVNAVNPKVMNREYTVYSSMLQGTMTANGWVDGVVTVQTQNFNNENQGHCGFMCRDAGMVTGWGITWRNGGDSSGGGQRVMQLYKMTVTQWNSNDFAGATLISALNSSAPASAGAASHEYASGLTTVVAARDVLVVRVSADWTGGIHKAGSFATVTIDVQRKV